jgi:hypothetical protein
MISARMIEVRRRVKLAAAALMALFVIANGSEMVGAQSGAHHLLVRNVRMEPAPTIRSVPSSFLRIDVENLGPAGTSDVTIEVTVFPRNDSAGDDHVEPLAGPYRIRGRVDLDVGSTVSFEMRVRNLESDCACRVDAAVVSDSDARSLHHP